MANEQNLKNINETYNPRVSREQHKKSCSKGGKISAEKKKERKTLKENIEMLMKLDIKDVNIDGVKQMLERYNIPKTEQNVQMAMNIAMIQQAFKGNVKAYELIRDTLGEKPIERVENINPPVINIERPKKK